MKKFLFFLFISQLSFAADPMQNYRTSDITDQSELNSLFKSLNRNKKSSSQCFDRAMTWSYQMYRDKNVFSQKYFIYFTRKYQREIWNKWWFHVAPGVKSNNDSIVFDPEFLNRPVTLEAWKNGAIDHAIKILTPIKINYEKEIDELNQQLTLNLSSRRRNKIETRIRFLKQELKNKLIDKTSIIKTNPENWPYDDNRGQIVDIDCPIINNYSDYEKVQEEAYCLIQISPMFIWEPSELEKMEFAETNKLEFINSEVYSAFQRAFRGRFPYRFE